MSTSSAPAQAAYWCYRCSCFVRVWARDAVVCPTCDGGFLEAVETPPSLLDEPSGPRRRRVPATAHTVNDNVLTAPAAGRPSHHADTRLQRNRRASAGDRSAFNPVIVLRSPSDAGNGSRPRRADADHSAPSSFELYYDDGEGSGLRPLPASMSEFLMDSGFDRILDQLSQMGINGDGDGRGCEQPPASKAAIESMPIIKIAAGRIEMDSHCAVCKEAFELGAEAREMPCNHIYHQDCIFPWLSLHHSCPVCRHEMPTESSIRGGPELNGGDELEAAGDDASEEDAIGLTIWRLPGGGFAIGRFSGGRGAGEGELPVVYTEVDGGFNARGAPRRVLWPRGGNRSRETGGIGRAFRKFLSSFGCFGRSTPSSSPGSQMEFRSAASHRNRRGSVLGSLPRGRRNRYRGGWTLEDRNGSEIARW